MNIEILSISALVVVNNSLKQHKKCQNYPVFVGEQCFHLFFKRNIVFSVNALFECDIFDNALSGEIVLHEHKRNGDYRKDYHKYSISFDIILEPERDNDRRDKHSDEYAGNESPRHFAYKSQLRFLFGVVS